MTTPITNAKASLREQVRARLKTLSAAERAVAATQLCTQLKASEIWRAAKSVLLFAPLPDELDLWPLLADALADGKLVTLPRFEPATKKYVAAQIVQLASDIHTGRFNVREPSVLCPVVPLNRLDLILVPGVGFDLHGRRLGRGKGFYDQLLADVRGKTCGVAFDEQLVAEIPMEPHDIPLNCILTPTRWIEP